MKVIVHVATAAKQTTQDMRTGDVAVVTDRVFTELHLLRTYDGFVSLERPKTTWGVDLSLAVTILPPGTEITLVTE